MNRWYAFLERHRTVMKLVQWTLIVLLLVPSYVALVVCAIGAGAVHGWRQLVNEWRLNTRAIPELWGQAGKTSDELAAEADARWRASLPFGAVVTPRGGVDPFGEVLDDEDLGS